MLLLWWIKTMKYGWRRVVVWRGVWILGLSSQDHQKSLSKCSKRLRMICGRVCEMMEPRRAIYRLFGAKVRRTFSEVRRTSCINAVSIKFATFQIWGKSVPHIWIFQNLIFCMVVDNLILFVWPLESTKTEFVWPSYDQNSERVWLDRKCASFR